MDWTLALFNSAQLLNVLIVALGLGLVIFFHELGHFLVAKWCDVYVERFSIGFGQPIFARKYGETEYVLGWLPFGGYVKMLGQDDMDPNQMTDEKVAENPRAYTAKSVPQRMAIISAGVLMNIITGTLFFVIVFSWGIMKVDRVAGFVQVGMPAWEHGMRVGDTITAINGGAVDDFDDVTRRTALSSGPITVSGFHDNGQTFELTMQPKPFGIRKIIGVGPAQSLQVIGSSDGSPFGPAIPGSSAAKAGFQYGDTIVAVDGQNIEDSQQLLSILNDKASQTVAVEVQRKGENKGNSETTVVELPPQSFIGTGIRMGMGKIEAIQMNSVAAKAGLQPGDRIAKVNGVDVESEMDPFRLTELFSEHAGETVSVTVTREVPGGSPETLTFDLIPEDRNPWSEPPVTENSPLSIPSIGVAYHLVPTVFSVREDSPAAKAGIRPRDKVTKLELLNVPGAAKDGLGEAPQTFEIGENNWAHAFWAMQQFGRSGPIKITFKSAADGSSQTIEMMPEPIPDWYLPTTRGLLLSILQTKRQAKNFPQAVGMGVRYTVNSIEDIYLTLRGLFTRDISPKGLSGPIGIAKLAYSFANVGLLHFMLFLGIISINLAVINFLPIPVLDGGHMVFLLWEGIFRRKPSEKVVTTATYFGLIFVLGLFMFVIYQDLFVSKT